MSLLPLTSLLIFAFLIPYQHMRFLFIPLIGAILSTGILIRTRCRLGTAMMLFLIPTIVASSGGIVLNCLSNSDWKPGGDYGWYSSQKPGWEHVQEIGREVETPLRIAYAGCNTPYKLYGPDFRNRVYYVPVNGIGSRLHHYRLQQYNYRAMASPITWRDNLLEQETDMLVVHPAAQWEMHWANRMPETFTRVFMDQGTSIFAVSHPTTPPIGPTIRLGALECRGFELRPRVVRSGGSLELTITWSVPEPMRGRSLEIRYQVEGIGQWTDHYPCPSASPRIIHRGVLPIPSDAPPGLRIIEAHLREPGSVPPVTCRLGDLEILPPSTARPAPPEILLPLDGQILDHHQSFRWDPVPGALGYKAEYQDPSGVIRHLRSRQNDLDLLLPPDFPASLGAGEYRWRVAAWCSDGTWSTFSPWRRFRTSAQESDPASSSSSASVPSSNRSRHSLVGRPVSGSQPLSR